MSTNTMIEDIKKMTVVELAELVKTIEDEFGVSAAAPVAVAAASAAGDAAPAAEKSEYKVELKETGSEKIKVIKALRVLVSGLGLKEAKEATENLPFLVAPAASKDDAERMKKALEEAGAKVELS